MNPHTHTDRLAAWLAAHPRGRRAASVMVTAHALAVWALATAPSAAASAGAAALGWTGLHDTYGVPLKDYFLSVVDTPEAITNNGQGVSLLDPETLLNWAGEAIQTGITHSTAAWWLTTITGFYIFGIGIALWLLRFALSGTWLVTLAQIARPVYNAVTTVANQLYLGPIAITLCAIIGGINILRGHRGRGWAIIGTGVLFTVLLLTVFADPITDLYSDHGLLATGRSVGFSIAQASRGGPYAAAQPLDVQLDTMLAQLVTHSVRRPLQVVNFGFVVDDTGSCAGAWSSAVTAANGQGAGPARAMASCGAPQALAHAQQFGGNDAVIAFVFLIAGMTFSLFIWYVAVSTFLVGLKAAFYGTVLAPSFMVGMTGLADRALAYARHCGWQLLIHTVEMAFYTAFLGVVVVWLGWSLTTTMLGTGTISVVPRMLILMVASVASLLLFRYVDKRFHADGVGTIARTIQGVWGNAASSGRAQYDAARDRVNQAQSIGGRLRDRFGRSTTDGDGDDGSEGQTSTPTPQFDTFKPRPSSRAPAAKSSATGSAAQTTARTGATQAADATATAGTRAAAGTAAEGAGAVVAPEVALPAAAAVAATHAVPKHRQNKQSADPGGHSAERRPPRNAANTLPRGDRHVSAADTSQGTFAARPSDGRRGMRDVTATATEVAPTGVEAPPLEQFRRGRQEAPDSAEATPLEFRSGRPTGTPENRKGEQS
jgi:hypothetical protein